MITFFKKVFSKKIMNMALEQFGTVSFGAFLIYALLGVGFVLLVALICYLFNKRKMRLSNLLAGIVMALYGSFMLQVTLVCRESGSRIGIVLDLFYGLRGPESDYHWMMIAYAVLNGMLFIPYGFALSLFSDINEQRGWVQCMLVLLISFGTSLLIETAQLLTRRGYYEVQDLFVNTLGGVIGWILFRMIYLVGEKMLRKREE